MEENKMLFIPHFQIAKYQMLQRDEIKISNPNDFFDLHNPAQLYCIVSRNRISINDQFISFDDKQIWLEFHIHNGSQTIVEKVYYNHDYKDLKELTIESEFPFNNFLVKDEFGSTLIGGKASYFLEHELIFPQVKHKEFLNYEVLYFGQSVLEGKPAPALDRILKHETMQEIVEDYLAKHYYKEIFTVLFSYKKTNMIDIPENVSDEERKSFSEKFVPYWYNPTNTQIEHTVNVVEASLINFFKPKYNDKFIKNPPSKYHTSFNALHEMNLKKVSFTFTLEGFNPCLYTKDTQRKDKYNIEYTF